MKKTGDTVTKIVSVIILGGLFITYLVFNLLGLIKSSGIIPVKELKGLLNKGEYVEAYADDIYGPVYTVNHTLNGLIPIGTEYYYEILDAQTGYVYFVRASKSFAKKADKGYAVAVRGKVRTMDSESFKYFDSENSSIIESGYKSGYAGKILYIDNFVFFNSILGVIASLLILVPILIMIFAPVSRKPINMQTPFEKTVIGIGAFLIFVGALVMIYTVTFLF